MSKADNLFDILKMNKNETEKKENGKLVQHFIEYRKVYDYGFDYCDTILVKFDILNKSLEIVNETTDNNIKIVVAAHEKLKELGWLDE